MDIRSETLRFLTEDYKLKTEYLNKHFERLWRRFGFFLTINLAFLGAMLIKDASFLLLRDWFYFALFTICVFWYVVGAQDKYLVETYRTEAKEAGERVAELLAVGDFQSAGRSRLYNVKKNPFQWRFEMISITKLPVITPISVAIMWLIAFGANHDWF